MRSNELKDLGDSKIKAKNENNEIIKHYMKKKPSYFD